MYVRFVVNTIDEGSQRRQGVMHAAWRLRNSDGLTPAHVTSAESIVDWFNRNLRVPTRFSRSRRRYAHAKAVCWFRPSAFEHIAGMRRLCCILEQCGTGTAQITTRKPGYVVYEDEYQICAVPFADTRA